MRIPRIPRPPGRVVIYALVFLSLLAQIPLLQRAGRLSREYPESDHVLRSGRGLQELRSALGGDRRAGYVTDMPGDSIGMDPLATERYYLTQYVLAPVVLQPESVGGFVVGNFEGGSIPPRYAHLRVIGKFDKGLFLFRGTGQ